MGIEDLIKAIDSFQINMEAIINEAGSENSDQNTEA